MKNLVQRTLGVFQSEILDFTFFHYFMNICTNIHIFQSSSPAISVNVISFNSTTLIMNSGSKRIEFSHEILVHSNDLCQLLLNWNHFKRCLWWHEGFKIVILDLKCEHQFISQPSKIQKLVTCFSQSNIFFASFIWLLKRKIEFYLTVLNWKCFPQLLRSLLLIKI